MTTKLTKTTAGLLAAVTLATTFTAFGSEAQARGRWGLGLGLFAATAITAAVVSNAYAGPYYQCRLVDKFNRFGEYVGTVKRCW